MPRTPFKPNILLIMSDQHRGDCLGIEHHPVVQTPNLDALAASGVLFSHCYSTCPVCVPARRSLLSGQYPGTHGARDNTVAPWQESATLPGILREAGYQTFLVGRSMHQFPHHKRFGFDHMVANDDYADWLKENVPYIRCPRPKGPDPHSSLYYSSGVMHNDWTARPWHLDESLHHTNWTVNEALRFLEKRDPSCPFFLVVSFLAPHPPLIPPAFYLERYLRQELPEPRIGSWAEAPPDRGVGLDVSDPRVHLAGEALRSCHAGYYGLINHIDDQIRRLVNPVDGIDTMTGEETVILYTSDHGEMLGDHYLWRKSLPYEGSAHIPLFIRTPRKFGLGRGQVADQAVSLEDIMPTLLDLVGLDSPESVEGKSLLPLLQESRPDWDRPAIHIEIAHHFHALTDGREKYICSLIDQREQFFDLVRDPRECHNLAWEDTGRQQTARWRNNLISRLAAREDLYQEDIRQLRQMQHQAFPVEPNSQRSLT
jgi:arylsulfatase A-like enzyme